MTSIFEIHQNVKSVLKLKKSCWKIWWFDKKSLSLQCN